MEASTRRLSTILPRDVIAWSLALALAIFPVLASAQLSMTGAGGAASSGGAAYTGPIDINGTPWGFWSTRCGAAAYSGNILDIWDSATGSTTETVLGCDGAGNIVVKSGSALATTCASGCNVKIVYCQQGTCNSAGDLAQPTNANRPTLNTSLLGGKIGMVFNGSTSCLLSTGTPTAQANPFTASATANSTGSSKGEILGNAAGGLEFGANDSAANQIFIYDGGAAAIDATASNSATHAAQALSNNTASSVYIDGTLTNPASAVGTLGVAASPIVLGAKQVTGVSCAGGNAFFAGNIFELGIWGSDKTANNSTMNSNQHTYWGF